MTREAPVVEAIIKRLNTHEDLLVFKNISGAMQYGDRCIRAGILKEGSSDLLVVRRLLITPEMVGSHLARLNVLEVKADLENDRTKPSRKVAQARFINTIITMGGAGGFVDNPDDAERIIYGV